MGPNFNIGYGINSRDDLQIGQETQSVNPESGYIAKKLHDHPIMKFFAVSAASIAAAHVAGRVVQRAGINVGFQLLKQAEAHPSTFVNRTSETYKKIQSIVDELEGVERIVRKGNDAEQLFFRDETGKIEKGFTTRRNKGFFFTKAELETANELGIESDAVWGMRQEIQQRLVSQARRLPYELPAMYVTQKAVIDPLSGENQDKRKVNWHNPVDVLTNFVTESTRNLALFIFPFEAGTGAASQFKKTALSYGDDIVISTARQKLLRDSSVSLNVILGQVGADSADILNKGMRLSAQSSGAFSAGVQAAREDSMHFRHFATTIKGRASSNAVPGNHSILTGVKNTVRSVIFNDTGTFDSNILDQLPGPFRGIGTGVRTARKRFGEIGEGYKAFEELMATGKIPKGINPESMQYVMRGGTELEDFAGNIESIGKGGPSSSRWRTGKFYQQQFQSQYQNDIKKTLVNKYNVSEEAANKFAQISTIKPPSSSATNLERNITGRILLGEDPLLTSATGVDFNNELYRRLGMLPSKTDARAIADNLQSTINKVDLLYRDKSYRNAVDDKISKLWNFNREKLVPQIGEGILPKAKLPYHSFDGEITYPQLSYLKRKTAGYLGIPLMDSQGSRISDDVISAELSRFKFNLDAKDAGKNELRAFLATNKQIGMPWNKGSFNAFGFRPLLASEALQKNFFAASKEANEEMDSLLTSMKQYDPVSRVVGDYSLPNTYVSQSGSVVDLNILKRRGMRFYNTLAGEFQIPIVGIKPFELFASKFFKAKQDRNIFQYISGRANNAFLGAEASASDDFYIWSRSGGRGYKGAVHAVSFEEGQVRSRKLKGLYEAGSSDAYQMGGRHVRLAIGETGKVKYNTDKKQSPVDRFRKLFSVSDNQERSIASFASRFKNRKADIKNPYVMAELLEKGELNAGKNKFVLRSGALVDAKTGIEKYTSAEVASAFEKNFNNRYLRNFGFSSRVISNFENNPSFSSLFELDFSKEAPRTFGAGKVKISSLKTEAQISEAMELFAVQGLKASNNLAPEAAAALKRADDAYLWRYLDNPGGPSYWDEAAPQSARSGTIATRLDQAKVDLYKAVVARQSITGWKDFSEVLPEMSSELARLKNIGAISGSEYSESVAALLSLQVNFSSFSGYNRTATNLGNISSLIDDITASPDVKKLLSEISSGRVGVQNNGLMRHLTPAFRKKMSVSAYEFDGMEYNPFGSDTVLYPTVSTAFARNPLSATASVMGINTWANPEAFSAASIPVGHLFERLNRFGGSFSMGLDTNAFNGPLSFYAKGIVSQRVLPITAAAAGFMTVDRTIGGIVHGKDENGEREYKPIVSGAIATGLAHAQAGFFGLVPGGSTYREKLDEVMHGEVPIRAGRYFPLGNTPWSGGQIKYYRPSWYRKFMSGHMYTDDAYGSPLERFAFGYDFSPLKPFSPYHYENKHYEDRPYPVTGEYFTGPWGPLGSALNMTVGKVLKPEKMMHEEELKAGLSAYTRVGGSGAVFSPLVGTSSGLANIEEGGAGQSAATYSIAASNGATAGAAGAPGPYLSGSNAARATIAGLNKKNSAAATQSRLPVSPTIVSASPAITQGSFQYQMGNLGYQAQELFGIYGFAFGAVRSSLGLGSQDFSPKSPVLRSSSKITSSTRSFWELNVGGLGDAPLSIEGDLGNVEFSEIIRRFVPKERTDVDYINPILNTMNEKAPWLPGSNYFIDFKTGDPYASVEEGELRLPGKGYEKLHKLHPDGTGGSYGTIDKLSILGDVAPYSDEYRQMLKMALGNATSPAERMAIEEIDHKTQMKKIKHEFTPYKYKYNTASDLGMNEVQYNLGRAWEHVAHMNTLFNTKFLPNSTAVEDWERDNVYGATFPQWQNPINDFIKPMVYGASQRNPFTAGLVLGATGSLFASSAKGKALAAVGGGVFGFVASSIAKAREIATGERYIPLQRKKEIALEENIDILTYIKNKHLASAASQSGMLDAAAQYEDAASRTMYGSDIYNGDIGKLASALPKRKREHFRAMLFAPEEEREQILSTAGRLERRIYQAAWGYNVEKRPDLNEYFKSRELPSADSSFWLEDTDMEYVKIKMGQSMGLDMSQMGYYPQQVKEANLVNPAYPSFQDNNRERNVELELQRIMDANNIRGRVVKTRSFGPTDRMNINAGVY